MRGRVLIVGGLCLLAALGAIWFYSNYERVPYKERVGPSGEARLRQFLAAERFARRMGMLASEIRSLPELGQVKDPTGAPNAAGVLLLPARRQALEPGRLREIVAYAERGGHLIAEAEFPGVSDPLLDLLDIERTRADPAGKPLAVEVDGGRRLLVSLVGAMALQPRADETVLLRAGPAAAPRLVSLRRGKGVVTVATTLSFAHNSFIGQNDHAEFFWQLLSLTGAKALLVYDRPERLSLTGFLGEHAPEAIAAALALLALWLWRIAPRFGPVAPDAPPARRRLLDHLRASGRYYWVKGLRAELVAATRDAALRRLARAQPDFAVAPQSEKVSRLATLTGISQEDASRFLAAGGPLRGADFIRLAHHAQLTHAALEKGKK